LYEQEGRVNLAENYYRQLIKIRPEANMPKARLSRLLLKSGRRKEAIALLNEISGQSPDPAQAGVLIGLVYVEENMLTEAEAEFKAVLRAFPENDQARYLLGSIYLESGRSAEALDLLLKIPPKSEQFVDARIYLSSILVKADRSTEALSLLRAARREAPWAPQLLVANGYLLEGLKRPGEARDVYMEGVKNFPDSAELYFRLGALEDRDGRTAESVKAMRQALSIDPDYVEALNYLAYSFAERGENLSEALSMAIRANDIRPDNFHIVDTLGWVYYAQGEYNKALPLLEKAARLSDYDPVISEHLGDVLARVGRRRDAKKAYDRAIRKGHEEPAKIYEKILKINY
jgi:tetratricopeptide (TPR) repeat protein